MMATEMQNQINIEWANILMRQAKDEGRRPRVHQNGFIQLDLAPASDSTRGHSGAFRRLHVFPWPLLEAQKTDSPIHDHVFDMWSEVLLGGLGQTIYNVDLEHTGEPTHEIYIPHYEKASESTLAPTGVLVHASERSVFAYGPDRQYSHYEQYAHTFHETSWSSLSMSVMTKMSVHDGYDCRVLVPIDEKPDNDFKRDSHPESMLWDIIDQAFERAGSTI